MADTWALGEDREVWIRVGFCPEETSSGPLCEWFQACPWTRITGVTHVPCEAAPADLSCFIGSCGPAPCYHGHGSICYPAVVSARKLPRRWARSFWISASGKGCLSAQVPPCFCLAPSIHPTKLLFLQQSWVGSCLVGAQTSRLGLVTLAAVQWGPLQQVREATCTSLVYILLYLAIHELYLMCSFSLEQSGPDLTNPLPYPGAGFWTPEQAVCGLLSLRSFLQRLWKVQLRPRMELQTFTTEGLPAPGWSRARWGSRRDHLLVTTGWKGLQNHGGATPPGSSGQGDQSRLTSHYKKVIAVPVPDSALAFCGFGERCTGTDTPGKWGGGRLILSASIASCF